MKYLIAGLFLFPLIALGQSRGIKSNAFQFHSINQMGLINGKKGNAFTAESIFGVQWHSWFAGLGAGIDHYYLRSLPVFLDLRKEFGKSSDHFFVYGDGGIDFGILRENDKEKFGEVKPLKVSKGIYLATGIGYKLPLFKKQSVSFSAGYSIKSMKVLVADDRVWRPDYLTTATYKYEFRRLDMKVGWIF